MSHIFKELHEIPIPEMAHVSHCDGRVYLLGSKAGGRKSGRKQVIGLATSETMMHPNTLFKKIYPDLWEKHYGKDKFIKNEIHFGLYTLVLAIIIKNGLYKILQDVYGPKYANALIDFAMFSIKCKTNVAHLYVPSMQDELIFSESLYSDSWYSNFFNNIINENDNINFRKLWLQNCKELGVKDAWIAIDGSSNLSASTHSSFVEIGHSKNNTEESLVSFIYAIDGETGLPLTYNINPGSVVDSQAFYRMIHELHEADIKIKGVILDRIFANSKVISTLEKL